MRCDLLVTWPVNCDYPLWRQFIRDHRSRFNDVVIIFTAAPGSYDYSQFVTDSMKSDEVTFRFSPNPVGTEDWRDVATRLGLMYCGGEWVWFTEQDFYPKEGFFTQVDAMIRDGGYVVAAYQGERMHPCSIFVERQFLYSLRHDFGIESGRLDHFGKMQEQIEREVKPKRIPEDLYKHMNGLSHNWRLVVEGQQPNHQPQEFIKLLKASLEVKVPLHLEYIRVANKAISAYSEQKNG